MRDRILDELLGIPEQTETLYDSLIPRRVNNLLLVASLYDSYTFIEDGRLAEMLLNEFMELNLQYSPHIHRVSTAMEALDLIGRKAFDLVISMPRVGEMNVREFGARVQERAPGLPVILLASSLRELAQLQPLADLKGIHDVFVWLGDVRLFVAMIKSVEDRMNAWHDARLAGVKCILVVEDSVPFYSANLPELYTEVMKQTLALMADGVNQTQRIIRRRARPKILLAHTFEEALEIHGKFEKDLVGLILDTAFPREGRMDPGAGPAFARHVAERTPDLPILVQSTSEFWNPGPDSAVTFVDKRSPDLRQELRAFMQDFLGFGEFLFRDPGGAVVSKANDLRSLEWAVQAVPAESLEFHARRGDFGKWLLVRTEFELSGRLARIIEQKPPAEDLRRRMLETLHAHRLRSSAGVVAEFSPGDFEESSRFARLGTGSLGGKGRGLAFINSLITSYHLEDRFPGIRIAVPPTLVLATSVFDRFMRDSGLMAFALQEQDGVAITRAFLAAELPRDVVDALWTFLDWVRYPLAVRSSSLLEDASYQPFAGIYETYMIPNNEEDAELRLSRLCDAVKRVYASTYHPEAKAYIRSTPNRLEEEKMAVVIQQMSGRRHGRYMYPNFAGVGRSLNFYPMPGMKPEEGVGSVALGLGKTVVDGGRCARFCPAQPAKPLQWFSPRDYVRNAQREFLALDLEGQGATEGGGMLNLVTLGLDEAAEHRTLYPVGGVYSPDNDAIYDGCSRPGVPLVTMAGVFKGSVFPLGEVLTLLLKAGAAANSCPVEMEFAVTLSSRPGEPHAFDFLQIRPMVMGTDAQDIPMEALVPDQAVCTSRLVMGNGFLEGIRDLVYVRPETFNRSLTTRIAGEVGELNRRLKGRPYLLLGPGRWGSGDPWLGIPVAWSQISGARCIVETDMGDLHVDPSQGSHFFQNLMAFGIGYLTVESRGRQDILDFAWLDAQPAAAETDHLRHLAFPGPLEIALNGRRNRGAVLKPGRSLRE